MEERQHSDLKADIKRRRILNDRYDLAHLVEHSIENRKEIGANPIIEANGGAVRLEPSRLSIFKRLPIGQIYDTSKQKAVSRKQ